MGRSGWGGLQKEALGFFEIVVDPAYRRSGLATNVIRALAGWGALHGARMAWFQVLVKTNRAGFIQKIGFLRTVSHLVPNKN